MAWDRSRLYEEVIYARPYMTYDMSTGVCMKTGAETGETLVVRGRARRKSIILEKNRLLVM